MRKKRKIPQSKTKFRGQKHKSERLGTIPKDKSKSPIPQIRKNFNPANKSKAVIFNENDPGNPERIKYFEELYDFIEKSPNASIEKEFGSVDYYKTCFPKDIQEKLQLYEAMIVQRNKNTTEKSISKQLGKSKYWALNRLEQERLEKEKLRILSDFSAFSDFLKSGIKPKKRFSKEFEELILKTAKKYSINNPKFIKIIAEKLFKKYF
jgi:predicted RND superfamily exporter protein